jgi:hypothetical protein
MKSGLDSESLQASRFQIEDVCYHPVLGRREAGRRNQELAALGVQDLHHRELQAALRGRRGWCLS